MHSNRSLWSFTMNGALQLEYHSSYKAPNPDFQTLIVGTRKKTHKRWESDFRGPSHFLSYIDVYWDLIRQLYRGKVSFQPYPSIEMKFDLTATVSFWDGASNHISWQIYKVGWLIPRLPSLRWTLQLLKVVPQIQDFQSSARATLFEHTRNKWNACGKVLRVWMASYRALDGEIKSFQGKSQQRLSVSSVWHTLKPAMTP